MKIKKTKTIALVTPSLEQAGFESLSGFDKLLLSIEKELRFLGYNLNIYEARNIENEKYSIIDFIHSRQADGIIFQDTLLSLDYREINKRINELKIPAVFLDRPNKNILPFINTNNYQGGLLAAEYLIKNNHKNIGIIANYSKLKAHVSRLKGFKETLKKHGLQHKFFIDIDTRNLEINRKIEEYKDKLLKQECTALFAATDLTAIYLIKFFIKNNIRIPEDISIISYGNIFYSKITNPELTTIDHKLGEIGITAARNLISKIEKGKYKKLETLLEPEIIIRDTVKKI